MLINKNTYFHFFIKFDLSDKKKVIPENVLMVKTKFQRNFLSHQKMKKFFFFFKKLFEIEGCFESNQNIK